MRGFPGDSDAKEVEEVALKVISRLQGSVSDQNRVMIIICDIIIITRRSAGLGWLPAWGGLSLQPFKLWPITDNCGQ